MSLKNIFLGLLVLCLGFILGYLVLLFTTKEESFELKTIKQEIISTIKKPEIVGFLPYWLLSKADKNYENYVTTLTYFSLTISADGTIQKYVNPGEREPGLYALESGKADSFLQNSKEHTIKRSLLVFSGDPDDIQQLMEDPKGHAQNLINDIAPIMKKYEFTDLNIDIENVTNVSERTQSNFTTFIKELKKIMTEKNLGTLTIDASPTDLIKERLINLTDVEPYVDLIVLMTYDYHYSGSMVTGPVAPVGGAGTEAEFDVETGIQKALEVIPKEKILLGIPLYGYEWETLGTEPRSATIPTSGLVISNRRIEEFLASCASCSANIDSLGKESYLVYKDQQTGTYHHVFFPDKKAMEEKIKLANLYELKGVALWALGYEGNTILGPLQGYKN